MKKQILALSILLLSASAMAGAVSSGGGAPPVPVYPETFQYNCHIRIDRAEATMNARSEASIEADYVINHDKDRFDGVIPLKDLNWKTVKSSGAIKVMPEAHELYLSFEELGRDYTAVLQLNVTQNSESGQYELNTYKTVKGSFKTTKLLKIEGNVEERANWINSQPPAGLLMSSTSVSASCARTR